MPNLYPCFIFILITSLSWMHLYPCCISILVASLDSLHVYPRYIFILVASLSLLHLYHCCFFILIVWRVKQEGWMQSPNSMHQLYILYVHKYINMSTNGKPRWSKYTDTTAPGHHHTTLSGRQTLADQNHCC